MDKKYRVMTVLNGVISVIEILLAIQPWFLQRIIVSFEDIGQTIPWVLVQAALITCLCLVFYNSFISKREDKLFYAGLFSMPIVLLAIADINLAEILVKLYYNEGFNGLVILYSMPMLMFSFVFPITAIISIVFCHKPLNDGITHNLKIFIAALLISIGIPIITSFGYDTLIEDHLIYENNKRNMERHLSYYEDAIDEFSKRGFNEYFEWFEGNDDRVAGGADGLIDSPFDNYTFDYYSKDGTHWRVVSDKDFEEFFAYEYDYDYSNKTGNKVLYVTEGDENSNGMRQYVHVDRLTSDVLDKVDIKREEIQNG